MRQRTLMILPLAAPAPAGKVALFGEDYGELRAEVAGGLALALADAAREWPEWRAVVNWAGAGDPERAGETLRLLRENAEAKEIVRSAVETGGEADFLAFLELDARGGCFEWTWQAVEVDSGRVAYARAARFPARDLLPVAELAFNELGAALAGEGRFRPARFPTRSVEAFLNLCAGSGAAKRFELGLDPRPRVAYERLLAALASDAQLKAAAVAVSELTERCLARPGLPRHLMRRALDQLILGGHATPIALRQRGLIEFELEEHARAMGWFRRAIAEGDDAVECARLLARCAEAARDWEEMAGWTARLTSAEPDNPDNHVLEGVAAIRDERLDDALACWRRALEMEPDLAMARANIALALLEANRLDEALDELEPALATDDFDWEFAHTAAIVLARAGETERAVDLANDFLETRDLSPAELLEAARFLMRVDEGEQARSVLDEVMLLAPSDESADVAARFLCELNEPGFEERFQEVAESVIARESSAELPRLADWTKRFGFCWHVWYVRAIALWQSGDPNGALAALEEAGRLRPSHPEILCKLSSVLLELGRHPESRAKAEEALACAPDDASIHSHCALALAYDRDFKGALARLREAQWLDPDDRLASLIRPLVRKLQANPAFPLPRQGRIPASLFAPEPRGESRDLQGIADREIVRQEHARSRGPRRLEDAPPAPAAESVSFEPAPAATPGERIARAVTAFFAAMMAALRGNPRR